MRCARRNARQSCIGGTTVARTNRHPVRAAHSSLAQSLGLHHVVLRTAARDSNARHSPSSTCSTLRACPTHYATHANFAWPLAALAGCLAPRLRAPRPRRDERNQAKGKFRAVQGPLCFKAAVALRNNWDLVRACECGHRRRRRRHLRRRHRDCSHCPPSAPSSLPLPSPCALVLLVLTWWLGVLPACR